MVRSQRDGESKPALRALLRSRLASIDPAAIHERSLAVAERLTGCGEFRRAATVMLFLALPGEVDTAAIALRAWQAQKAVTVPLVSHEQKHMIPVLLRSFDEPMALDRYGVRTPATGEPMPISMIDLLIVPGLGFDLQGHRIGRGAGFFDRFLARSEFRGIACGIAFEDQIVESIPTQQHDIAMDMLVTDQRVARFKHERV